MFCDQLPCLSEMRSSSGLFLPPFSLRGFYLFVLTCIGLVSLLLQLVKHGDTMSHILRDRGDLQYTIEMDLRQETNIDAMENKVYIQMIHGTKKERSCLPREGKHARMRASWPSSPLQAWAGEPLPGGPERLGMAAAAPAARAAAGGAGFVLGLRTLL